MGRGVHIKDSAIIDALRACKGLIYLAARKLRCDPSTIHRRANRSQKIKAVIEQERQEFVDTAELALLNAVAKGEAWAVCFALKTQGRMRGYWERQEVRQETKVVLGGVAEELTDDELAAIASRGGASTSRTQIGEKAAD